MMACRVRYAMEGEHVLRAHCDACEFHVGRGLPADPSMNDVMAVIAELGEDHAQALILRPLKEAVYPGDGLSTEEVLGECRLSRRQIHYAVANGWITPSIRASQGSGRPVRWSEDDLKVLHRAGELMATGLFTPFGAFALARAGDVVGTTEPSDLEMLALLGAAQMEG